MITFYIAFTFFFKELYFLIITIKDLKRFCSSWEIVFNTLCKVHRSPFGIYIYMWGFTKRNGFKCFVWWYSYTRIVQTWASALNLLNGTENDQRRLKCLHTLLDSISPPPDGSWLKNEAISLWGLAVRAPVASLPRPSSENMADGCRSTKFRPDGLLKLGNCSAKKKRWTELLFLNCSKQRTWLDEVCNKIIIETSLLATGRKARVFIPFTSNPYNTKFFAHIGRLPVSGAVFGINKFK